jgi:hypothetical protein
MINEDRRKKIRISVIMDVMKSRIKKFLSQAQSQRLGRGCGMRR